MDLPFTLLSIGGHNIKKNNIIFTVLQACVVYSTPILGILHPFFAIGGIDLWTGAFDSALLISELTTFFKICKIYNTDILANMEEIYDVLPANSSEDNISQNLESSAHQIATETSMELDDTDELAELFAYFNYTIFLLENDIYLPIIMRTGSRCHQYENVYIVYTENVDREHIRSDETIPDLCYENIGSFINPPYYENMHVQDSRRNIASYISGDYISIDENPQNFRNKSIFQKIKDFFSCTEVNVVYEPPLSKIVFSNGDVFYKYTEDNRDVTIQYPTRNKNLNQNEPAQKQSLPVRSILTSDEESIYEYIDNIPKDLQCRPLPTPPPSLPPRERHSVSSDTYETIYEEIGFHNQDGSLCAVQEDLVPHSTDPIPAVPGDSSYGPHKRKTDPIYIAGGSDITYDAVQWCKPKPQKNVKQSFHLIWSIVCTGMYIMDIGSDMLLAIRYWTNGENLYCGLTLSLVYTASTLDLIYSIYIRNEFIKKNCIYKFKLIIMFVMNVRGIFEYLYLLQLEYKDLQTRFVNTVLKRNLQLQKARIATLNFYEGMFEACPQIVLQVYLILMTSGKDFNTVVFQGLSVISSLCVSGAAFVNMEKGVRLEDYGTNDLSIVGLIVQYLWLSPITASRLLSVALLLLVAPRWLWLGAALHLLLGATLYWCLNEAPASPHKLVNACVYGARVLMSPYEPTYERTYERHVVPVLNIVHALQNAAATAVWAAAAAPSAPFTLVIVVCAVNIIAHALGLLFGILFYKCKRRFYTFHKVTVVDYGYAVVQIV